MQSKTCPACEHVERTTIAKALGIGLIPRSIVRRYAEPSRKAVQRRCDKRHDETTANDRCAA